MEVRGASKTYDNGSRKYSLQVGLSAYPDMKDRKWKGDFTKLSNTPRKGRGILPHFYTHLSDRNSRRRSRSKSQGVLHSIGNRVI